MTDLPGYDAWKTTPDPDPDERVFQRCPLCRFRHWSDEDCAEAEYEERDPLEDRL